MKQRKYIPVLVAALLSCNPVASANGSSKATSTAVAKIYSLYACTLRPFNRNYIDVAMKEHGARAKVSRRCQAKEGKVSIFCKKEDAECTAVEVKIRE